MENEFRVITKLIINSATRKQEVTCGTLLEDFFTRQTNLLGLDNLNQQNTEAVVIGGIALSPLQAIDCTKEYYRTTRFIKSVYRAINVLFKRFPQQQINILYAGCGPYAPLILPVLTLLPRASVKVTLLDISTYSINSVTKLASLLNLEEFIADALVTDASAYQKPANETLHLVITETMFRALTREPQVSVTANLAPQLVENGILIPEEIKVEAGYTFFNYEPYFQYDNELNTGKPAELPVRKMIGTLFVVNKNNYLANAPSKIFESNWYRAPREADMDTPDLCVFTTLKIFEDIYLHTTESAITNPHSVQSIAQHFDDQQFRLTYNFTDVPYWQFELK
jgi:hypothetical protein